MRAASLRTTSDPGGTSEPSEAPTTARTSGGTGSPGIAETRLTSQDRASSPSPNGSGLRKTTASPSRTRWVRRTSRRSPSAKAGALLDPVTLTGVTRARRARTERRSTPAPTAGAAVVRPASVM
ncbi:hypothetical protein ADK54_38810 [Streptomyces sp. WM6378]|nr:hypothetical protein [Streptomyces sp. WM6378]KOU35125.1 hypothetical protein ADK54_38810 [Streptomyces sp. WM6378]